MRGIKRVGWVAAIGLLLAACSSGANTATPPTTTAPAAVATTNNPAEYDVKVTVPAPSLEGNLLGDPAEREVLVRLPPSYFDGDKRYPVVYFLEGWQERIGRAFSGYTGTVGKQMQAAGGREFIIVEADGDDSLDGTFYANSPVHGNAADFITDDLVKHIDANYRTIADRTARGLAGFSMGGGGTINLGLAHPDVYGAIYAQSPGALRPDDGLQKMLDDNGAWVPYAAAFSPDPTATAEPFAHLLDPNKPLDAQDPSVVAAYESGFGNLEAKVTAYLAQPVQLSQIRLAYGTSDSYEWIPEGTQYLDQLLTAKGVPHSLRTFQGGHEIDGDFYPDFVDYFSQQFGAAAS